MGHHHNHQNNVTGKNLKIAFFLNLGFTILELTGGIYVNSIAIISDAIHDLGDSLSIGTAWFLEIKSKQKADSKFSYGYRRFSLLGALINSLVLIIGSIYVINEGIKRIISPEASDAKGMIVFAIIGIVINGYAAWKVSGGKSLNEKVISWHLLEDVLGWVAVLVAGILIYFTNIQYLDPILSLIITFYILFNVFKRLKETLFIFLQGVPKEIDTSEINSKLLKVKNIDSIHHTHVWSLEGEHHVFTTHIKLKQINSLEQLRDVKYAITKVLEPYHFEHCTIETEFSNEPRVF